MLKISGTFCAALTPLNEDYSINKDLFLDHCSRLLLQNLDGLGIFGTTGEANSFNLNQKIDAINFLINNNIDPKKLIIGTGLCSINDTVSFTKNISNLNIKAVLVLPPFYYKDVSNEGVIEFYKRVIEEVGDNELKYILYHFPKLSGVPINFEIIEKLLKLFPQNVVGIKDASADIDFMLKIIKYFGDFAVFSGSDSLALKICKQGGAGAITATSNISGKLLSFIYNNYQNEDEIENFQNLQVKIRDVLSNNELISTLKAYMSVTSKKSEWNRVNPPLKKIQNPENNKTVIGLIELTKKMEELLSNT